jgi:hypothetical protein
MSKRVNLKSANQIAHGTNKNVFAVMNATANSGEFNFSPGSIINIEFVTVKFKNSKSSDIYNELMLYHNFGIMGISPIIYGVNIPRIGQMSLESFIKRYNQHNVPTETMYIVEKLNCDRMVIDRFTGPNGFDAKLFFDQLRDFFTSRIVANGIINTDIKIPNLCVDNNGNIKMIDLDPNFIKQIDTRISARHYVNYMLLQVYINLVVSYKQNIPITDVFSKNNDADNTVKQMYNFNDSSEFHPIFMLLWYSKNRIQNSYISNIRKIYTERNVRYMILSNLIPQVPSPVEEVHVPVPVQEVQIQSPPTTSMPWVNVAMFIAIAVGLRYVFGKGTRANKKKTKSHNKKGKKSVKKSPKKTTLRKRP